MQQGAQLWNSYSKDPIGARRLLRFKGDKYIKERFARD